MDHKLELNLEEIRWPGTKEGVFCSGKDPVSHNSVKVIKHPSSIVVSPGTTTKCVKMLPVVHIP